MCGFDLVELGLEFVAEFSGLRFEVEDGGDGGGGGGV